MRAIGLEGRPYVVRRALEVLEDMVCCAGCAISGPERHPTAHLVELEELYSRLP
jgi:hypothetical protein